MDGKRILLVISGGIAAYKSLDLIRRLREQGVAVRCILTEAASHLVTPLSVAALSEERVYQDLFSLTDETEIGHIRLSREADLVVVAPATANILAKMAAGIADDLATTALLAADAPILVAPAMNVVMWEHPATRRNLALLVERGVHVVGPASGELACGETGAGRMAEPADILAAVAALLARSGALAGRRALVTSGPTFEPIDPVRFLGNRSSGRQGHAIAAALATLGADTVLVSGPTALPDPPGVTVRRVETAREMLAACLAELPADVAVCAAAVADWRVASPLEHKLKKAGGRPPALRLVENPDIVAAIAAADARPRLVVGFAAETEDVVGNAAAKRQAKGCDWILANDVAPGSGVLGGDRNTVHLVTAAGVEPWPTLTKDEVARRLAERIAGSLTGQAAGAPR
ncbi:MAG TPA: bifunctional phosphopantothenoylcysteine decarboxylase/phosphopantothenate--cysteine ligase CoaBC [Thermoanaerobaculales bacterium]|nr:bifunctional phosphopantothenoylcysteine decarboxylase/phosphopantothenate--cysteine ligase CoaBC [Thermoanaerobaculales bacterium]HPA81070.1 bifunctional phosphopantothenoylcysteine decarboxylase/phosphopantothenate--cysteine ligase CoaBC [Thermoanaerobaculales bacterium]HQL30666.1 bifunctional phosphopantothenoylcysteine decarboxylase/phosphopantothenate--cysteine ligase CoaBC [Thermoanaerobaculales bacterium]HQN95680.1 bifunctional phosphopantothenoylcysteine decarboxylase/phosphopantothen